MKAALVVLASLVAVSLVPPPLAAQEAEAGQEPRTGGQTDPEAGWETDLQAQRDDALRIGGTPGASCELHIWPATDIGYAASGFLSNLGLAGVLLDQATRGGIDERRRAALDTALDARSQLAVMKALDPVALFGLEPSQVVPHDDPVEANTISRFTTPRALTYSPCYAELYVAELRFTRSTLGGTKLKLAFAFRDFAGRRVAILNRRERYSRPLERFPAKTGEEAQAAVEELYDAMSSALAEFAADMNGERGGGDRGQAGGEAAR